MLSVGLTGGVSSGKSAVAGMLARLGAATLDADRVVGQLYSPGGTGTAAVVELFGDSLLDDEGGVDHAALAQLVLARPGERRRLEAAVHPLVRDEIRQWLMTVEAGQAPPAVAVVEAALLVETGSYRDYERIVVVSAPGETRHRRTLALGWPAERFARTLSAQTTDLHRESVADYVVSNDSDLEALGVAVDRLWTMLLEDARLKASGKPLPARN